MPYSRNRGFPSILSLKVNIVLTMLFHSDELFCFIQCSVGTGFILFYFGLILLYLMNGQVL